MGLFSKEACAICGKEVGALKRTKIQNKEFICNECDDECSKYIDLYLLTKDDAIHHIESMRMQEKLYRELFEPAMKNGLYIKSRKGGGIAFCDELGMFQIFDIFGNAGRKMHEIFRYDQVMGYEPYAETVPGKSDEYSEIGVKISFLGNAGLNVGNNAGRRPHPFIEKDIKLCFEKKPGKKEAEKAIDTAEDICRKFDRIFGVKDAEKALIQIGLTKDEKRKVQAGSDMIKGGLSMLKAAKAMKAGEEVDEEAVKEQLQKASDSADDANTSGLARFTRAADDAEQRAWGL